MSEEHKPHSEPTEREFLEGLRYEDKFPGGRTSVELAREMWEAVQVLAAMWPDDARVGAYRERYMQAHNGLLEQLEAAQRELRDATRMLTAIVATCAPDGRFLRVTPGVLTESYELTRMDDLDGSIVFVASSPASEPERCTDPCADPACPEHGDSPETAVFDPDDEDVLL